MGDALFLFWKLKTIYLLDKVLMKKFFYCSLLFAIALITACSDDDPAITLLTSDANGSPVTRIELGPNKDVRGSIVFESSDAWEAVATSTDDKQCDWLSVSPMQGKAGKFTVTLKALTSNMTGEERTAILTLYGGGKALQAISITQAKMDFIEMDQDQYTVSAEGGAIEVPFTASLPDDCNIRVYYNASMSGWAQVSWMENTRSLMNSGIRVLVDPNQFVNERTAQLQFRVFDSSEQEVLQSSIITLTQSGTGALRSTDMSHDGEVKKLLTHTKGDVGIPLIIMGDGFVDSQIASGYYDECMKRGVQNFFSEEPLASLRDYFDVWQVTVVSPTNVLDANQETALKSYCTGDGTLITGDDNAILSYAVNISDLVAENFQLLKETSILVVMNTDEYAGTCYFGYNIGGETVNLAIGYAPMIYGPRHEICRQVMVHENAGHGFAKLGDEYAYQSQGAAPADEIQMIEDLYHPLGWFVNVSTTYDPDNVPWKKFLQDNRYQSGDGNGYFLSVIEGAYTYMSGLWRPTDDSMMNSNTAPFNVPSREAIYKRVMSMAYGNSWMYDYEDFVAFDQTHLPVNSVQTRILQRERDGFGILDKEEIVKLPSFHRPIFVDKSIY